MRQILKTKLFLLSILTIIISSCEPSDSTSSNNNNNSCNIETPIPTAVTTNVYQANTIELSVQELGGYVTYHWTGPNGFESFEREPKIRFATTDMSGEYKVKYIDGNCESEFGIIYINVVEPIPSCSLNNNTSVMTTYGTKTITSAYTSNYNTNYRFYCSGSQVSYNLEFSKHEVPVPGIYKIVNSFSTITTNEVILNGTYTYYFAASNGYVYIKYDSNNKMNVQFCDIDFGVIYNYIPDFTASLNATQQ